MPVHDDDHLMQVFNDTYTMLVDRAPEAPTLEEITIRAVNSSQPASVVDDWPGDIDLSRSIHRADRSSDRSLDVDYLRLPDESATLRRKTERFGLVVAVAAAILVVIGLVVVADGNSSDVATGPASSPVEDDPVPAPSEADPVASPTVTDPLGNRWSGVPDDEAVFDGATVHSVTVGGPGFVAVGLHESEGDEDAAVWTSIDGITWSRVPHDEAVFGGAWLSTVTVGGPGLVAIGTDGSSLWTSVDGLTWKRHEGVFDGSGPNDVTAGGPGLVAVGEGDHGAAVWTSVDGLTWTRVPHDEAVFGHTVGDGNGMTGVTMGGSGLVAVGSDGLNSDNPTGRAHAVVWTSVDGLAWSRVPHDEAVFGGPGDQGMFDVTVGGPGLVAVGQDAQGAPVWTSVDGFTWSRVPHDEAVFGGPDEGTYPQVLISTVIAAGSGLVAVGKDNQGRVPLWTSVDGVTWSRVPDDEAVFDGADLGSVTVGGPGLVAVGGAQPLRTWRTPDWSNPPRVWVATPES